MARPRHPRHPPLTDRTTQPPHPVPRAGTRRPGRRGRPRTTRAFAITVLTLDVGPRKSELAALDLAALDLADWPGTITITDPAGADRTVPITAATRAALVAWLAERRRLLGPHRQHVVALFLTETAPHRRLAHRTVDDIVRGIGHDADLDLSPGALRATAEQHLLHQGHPPATVAARLGQQTPDPQRIRALLGRPATRHRAAVPVDGQLDLFSDLAAG
ncbi:site-specific integrase [Nocardia takedensis]|uniref:site-specific integrase n=1 Tax=Nocardia takedensis TaxID=259390 RepID=UPI003F76CFC5